MFLLVTEQMFCLQGTKTYLNHFRAYVRGY